MNVLRKELRTLVVSPFAWAVATAFVIVSGLFFVALLFSYQVADLERYYSNIETTFVVVAPVVAMRSFAEERRTGVLELTLSWPVARWQLVIGKFVANTAFAWLLATVAWLYVVLLDTLGPVHVAKAFSGFLGVLLLTSMFNAIALFVSARASSPAGAAFVGFAVLLGLWTLDFVPGWLGGRFGPIVSQLAPTTHLEASGRGLLDLGDVLYFVAGTMAGLVLCAWSLAEPGVPGWRGALARRSVIPLVAAFGAIVLGASAANATGQVDLTPARSFTLTPQSRAVVDTISEPVQIIGVVKPGSAQQAQMQALVRMYQVRNDDISLDFLDPDAEPSRARQLRVSRYGQMVVGVGDRREVIDDIGEVELTSALQRVGRIEPPRACFTVGHGERSVDDRSADGFSRFALELRQLGYDTATLALGAAGGQDRLDSCAVVIVGGPRARFEELELSMLQEFAAAEGRLVVFADPLARDDITGQLNELVERWGLSIGDGLVEDRSSLIDDPGSVVAFSYPSDSPVTKGLRAQRIPVLLVSSRPIESTLLGPEAASRAWLVPLVESSSRGDDGRREGRFVLAALTDWSRVENSSGDPAIARTRIGVVGTAELGANQFIDRFGNLTFATGLVSWVAIEDDIIAAARDPVGVTKLALVEDDRARLVRRAVVYPALIGAAGFGAMLLRARRG
jgi:ABC-2 type transport system permease protein